MHSLLNKVFMSPESLSMVLSNLKEILSRYLNISFKAEFFFFFNESVKGCHGNNDGLVKWAGTGTQWHYGPGGSSMKWKTTQSGN